MVRFIVRDHINGGPLITRQCTLEARDALSALRAATGKRHYVNLTSNAKPRGLRPFIDQAYAQFDSRGLNGCEVEAQND